MRKSEPGLLRITRPGSHGVDANRVQLCLDVGDAALDLDRAVLCGLINELVSNALKYAFPEGRAGRVCVALRAAAEGYTLVVSDNGVGLPSHWPETVDNGATPALGLQLVRGLAEQLGGSLTVEHEHGTTFRIGFPPQS